ncbi:hypothetical protein [Flaviaesturariibacter terrae]
MEKSSDLEFLSMTETKNRINSEDPVEHKLKSACRLGSDFFDKKAHGKGLRDGNNTMIDNPAVRPRLRQGWKLMEIGGYREAGFMVFH